MPLKWPFWWVIAPSTLSAMNDTPERRAEYKRKVEQFLRQAGIRGVKEVVLDNEPWGRDTDIANFVALLKADGWKSDAAVRRAREVYGVGRTTVTNAMKKHKVRLPDMTPAQRRSLIKNYEREAAKCESNDSVGLNPTKELD
jgi:hypothetical protein